MNTASLKTRDQEPSLAAVELPQALRPVPPGEMTAGHLFPGIVMR